jgi:hypothetical protein
MNTDEMLDYLSQFGRPWVCRNADGSWSASLDLPAPDGCTAEIKSWPGPKHKTHRDALTAVISRLGVMRGVLADPDKTLPTIR